MEHISKTQPNMQSLQQKNLPKNSENMNESNRDWLKNLTENMQNNQDLKKSESENDKRIRAIYGVTKCPLNLCFGDGNRMRWSSDNNYMVPYVSTCECRKETNRSVRLKASKLPNYGFEEFDTIGRDTTIRDALEKAKAYVKMFPTMRYSRSNSMAFLSKSVNGIKTGIGAGKTHLAVATARNIIMDTDATVVYMPYREVMSRLKMNMTDPSHRNEMSKYKTANLLVIDDLFKGSLTPTDTSLMYEIVNYRYEKNLPMIITSEFDVEGLNKLDPGVGSRIEEMCKLSTIEMGSDNPNINSNYRRR